MARNNSADDPAPARLEEPSFLQHRVQKRRSPNQTDLSGSHLSSESSHPSPKSTISSPRVRKLRQSPVGRSISAPAGTIPEFGVPSIASLQALRQSNSTQASDGSSIDRRVPQQHFATTPPRRQRSSSRARAESLKSSVSSVTHRLRSHLRNSLPDFRIPECRISNSAKELFPPRKERPGYEWTKPSKKDDWVERLISTSGLMQRHARATDPPPVRIVPLRPPLSRNISGTGSQYIVKLETPFANPRPVTPLEMPQRPDKNSKPSIAKRTRSIIAKRVRFALHRSNSTESRCDQKTSSSTSLRTSLLSARNRTAEGLHRVASILHLMIAEAPSHPTSNRANQSHEHILPTPPKPPPRKGGFHLPIVIGNRARKSTNHSNTSSIRKMRQGATPTSTPNPQETYRIKRSGSAETEEFIKIDISVRGGTSYLASEARRIHTPPLPGDGPGEKRRGFFFDYTAPWASETPRRMCAGTKATATDRDREQGRASAGVRAKRARTVGGADWYEAQLAEVDAVGNRGLEGRRSTVGTAARIGSRRGPGRVEIGGEEGEEEGEEEEEEEEEEGGGDEEVAAVDVDLNVPEHLPSSPLCPRHAKHKSKGMAVCWMHGRNRKRNRKRKRSGNQSRSRNPNRNTRLGYRR